MKTSEDIRIQAQLISSIQIDPTTCFEWVKNEIDNIAYDHYRAGKFISEEITTTTKNEMVTLSKEPIVIDSVMDKNQNGVDKFDNVGNKTLILPEPSTYTVRYYSVPDKPSTRTTDIDMPTQYINALKFYVAARIRARLFGQADNNAVSFFQEYGTTLQNADNSMNRVRSRHNRMPPSYKGI